VPSGHEIRLLKVFCSECSLCDRLWLKRLSSFVDKLFMTCMGLSGNCNIPAYLSWHMQHGTCRQELVLFLLVALSHVGIHVEFAGESII